MKKKIYIIIISLITISQLGFSGDRKIIDPWDDEQSILINSFLQTAEDLLNSKAVKWHNESSHSIFKQWLNDEREDTTPTPCTCICWELPLLIAYEAKTINKIKANSLEYSDLDKELLKRLINKQTFPYQNITTQDIDKESEFTAGTIIFMNSYKHIVIASGESDIVYSLWNQPKKNNYLQKVSLSYLVENWPTTDKVYLQQMIFEEFCQWLIHN